MCSRRSPARLGRKARVAPTPSRAHDAPHATGNGALDRLLRFTGDTDAAARLDAAYCSFLRRTSVAARTAALVAFAVAYATTLAVRLSYSTGSGPAGYAVPACIFAVLCATVPVIRRGPQWGVVLVVDAAAAITVLGVGPNAPLGGWLAWDGYNFAGTIALGAAPLACGVLLTPRWRVYGVVCSVHAARAIGTLSTLGVLPPLVVCIASVLGTAISYLHELSSRENFVRVRSLCA